MADRKRKPMEINDLLQFRYPSGLMYSPDGKLAFTVAEADAEKNTYRRNVWIHDGNEAKQVTWTVDAAALLWISDHELLIRRKGEKDMPGTTAVFLYDIEGGEARPYTVLPFPLNGLWKLADGRYIAAGTIDANDPDAYLDSDEIRRDKLKKKEADKDYTVVDEVPYWFNGKGFTNKTRTALFDVDLNRGRIKRITGPFDQAGSVAADGKRVYFTVSTWERKQVRTSQVKVYSVDTHRVSTVYGKDDCRINNLFILNGRLYAQASDMKEYGVTETGNIVEVQKNRLKYVTDPERQLSDSAASDTTLGSGKQSASLGDRWITLATDTDHVAVWQYDRDFRKTVLYDEPGLILCMDAAAGKTAFIRQSSTQLCEVYELKDGKAVQLTHINDAVLDGRYIARPVPLDYESEGVQLRGWVLLPQDYDRRKSVPGVLDVHGGPRAVYTESYFHEMQVWVSRGYAVFFTNIRGSDGRDDAFADIRGQYGSVDFRNLMDFTDAVLAAYPKIDPARLCETGGSYGGFMTNWIVGHTDRFCACASQRSIANWISKLFISDNGLWFNADQQGIVNDIFEEADKLWEHSPLKYAENAKTPVLFIHSDEDYRCPLPEGMQMMQALAVQNIETRMVIFHGENHELSRGGKPVHRIRRLQEITDWFDKHTKEN